jgi:hypothetical protein
MKRLIGLILILLASTAQAAEHPLIKWVPGNPLVLVSGQDPAATFEKFQSLELVKTHAETKDRESFDDSKLALKLQARAKEFSEFAEHDLAISTLLELAGDHVTLALYDIGELRFLLLSDLSTAGQAALAYLDQYDSLDARTVGGRTYRVKEDPDRGLTLALHRSDGLLAVSNDITLIEGALRLAAEEPGDAFIQTSGWTEAIASEPATAEATTLIALDMSRLTEDRYFRNYWTFGNVKSLSDYVSVVSAIEVNGQEFSERRVVAGAQKVEGRTLAAKGLPGAWWTQAGAGKDPSAELAAFFRWSIGSQPDWKEHLVGRLFAVRAIDAENRPLGFAKVAALATDGSLTAEQIAKAIENGAAEKLLIRPENFQFDEQGEMLSFEPAIGFPGAYVMQKGSVILVANDQKALVNAAKMISAESDPAIEEATFVNLSDQAPLWAKAFAQMGPNAVFSDYEIGEFFSTELTGLLKAAGNFDSYSFEAKRAQSGLLIQNVRYER